MDADEFLSDRILVGVDGSSSSVAALRYAAHLAEALDAPLEAVTTWTYPPFSAPYTVIDWSPENDAAAILEEAIDAAFGPHPPERLTRKVRSGPAARTLIDMSEHSALLVLGSRGRGGFAGLLLGSVSATCVEHAQCPVLIMRGRAVAQPDGEAASDHGSPSDGERERS